MRETPVGGGELLVSEKFAVLGKIAQYYEHEEMNQNNRLVLSSKIAVFA